MADTVVIDAKGHLLGRLASITAKQLLNGKKIAIVRAEQIVVSGSLARNKVKYAQFVKKRHNTNPRRGPFHFRSPARIFWRTVRGMMPHRTERGQQAMARLAMFEGVPAPYDKVKRVVVPEALKAIRMRADRNFCVLGNLSQEFGWNYGPLVERLEAQRKIKEQAFYAEKKAKVALASKAAGAVDLSAVNKVLASNGF
mmetsp:Transcript_1084/g.2251  ORF Transcript_1084/g.2251 Transcript_1084/m.2251 type:complete len:198 (+) Transcript_1084:58-651(+)|eukprot:CAMPEP_0116917492 /NCGR_PEP_ID=MMETSP0467-20121206/19176_1 /TAXON_ID=283647 /ORGANISM="Mesodinium pulex, Strain SPMC105" /LENGTH=197 /DNA_ID=CAMNT_0004594597 /DNA_START=40 /DNA_END=633 /DNA_ORIENTATION=-